MFIAILIIIAVTIVLNYLYDLQDTGSNKFFISRLPCKKLTDQINKVIHSFTSYNINSSVNPELFASSISRAYYDITGEVLDENPGYRALILAIIIQETGFRKHKKFIPWLPIPEIGGETNGVMQARGVSEANLFETLLLNLKNMT